MLVNPLRVLLALGVLSFGFGFYQTNVTSTGRLKESAERISERVARQVQAMEVAATAYTASCAAGEEEDFALLSERAKGFDFFLLHGEDVVLWTTNAYWPPTTQGASNDLSFLRYGYGDFLIKRWPCDSGRVIVGMMPLVTDYNINNQYLKPRWNAGVFENSTFPVRELSANEGEVVSYEEFPVFRIAEMKGPVVLDSQALASFGIGLIALSFALLLWLRSVVGSRPIRLTVLAVYLVALRFGMVAAEFPARQSTHPVWNPANFASSALNPSLGDLFLNSITVFLLCVLWFRISVALRKKYNLGRIWIGTLAVLAGMFGMLFPWVVIQTVYNNSSLALSVGQTLLFTDLRMLALGSVILASVSSFLFVHVAVNVWLDLVHRKKQMLVLALGILGFVLINMNSGQVFLPVLIVSIIYLSMLWLFKLPRMLRKFSSVSFAYLFLAVISYAGINAWATLHYDTIRQVKASQRLARQFLNDRDYFGEYLLAEVRTRIMSDGFIQARISGPFSNREAVRQKIRQVVLPGYFARYNVELLLFSNTGNSLEQSFGESFSQLVSRTEPQANKTEYAGVYFLGDGLQGNDGRYLLIAPVSRQENILGYIVIRFSLRQWVPENVYPDLLIDSRFSMPRYPGQVSYGLFSSGKMVSSSGVFNYRQLSQGFLGQVELYTGGAESHGYRHVATEDQDNNIIVVSAPAYGKKRILSDVAFFLLAGISVLILFLSFMGVRSYFTSRRLYLAARIQLAIALAIFVPLVLISSLLVGYMVSSTQDQLNEDYLAKAKNFAATLTSSLGEADSLRADNPPVDFISQANAWNLDATLFDLRGHVLTTTQPKIFENRLLAPALHTNAVRLQRSDEPAFVAVEEIGELVHYVAYANVSNHQGEPKALVGIPFYRSRETLDQLRASVFADVLPIFTAVFVVMILLSFAVSRWITYPLRLITPRLSRISWVSNPQPIEWKADDEIGLMVKEYNAMLDKLKSSKSELERVQREQAWREIAQQVAHEIKNPLTPMKLTLQQLQRNQSENQSLQKSLDSLLVQIDLLNGIASSFSSFARMPVPQLERVDVVEVINGVMEMYRQEAEIHFHSTDSPCFALADKALLIRIVSNLVLNGIQAAESATPQLEINVKAGEEKIRVQVRDNGRGIGPEMYAKVFQPHFTTKKTGSGLGLAIARQGIEQMGGEIGFESRPGQGSTFFFTLPAYSSGGTA